MDHNHDDPNRPSPGPTEDFDFHVPLGGYWDLLHMVRIEPGRPGGPGRVMLEVQEEHLRSLGLMHGGVAASLLDSFMGQAAMSASAPGHHVVTIQLNVHFIRTARVGDTLIADGEVQHAGRSTVVVRGELRNAQDALIATASGTFMHLPTGT